MGTTLCAVRVVPGPEGDEIAWINVGDSRVYLYRDGQLLLDETVTREYKLADINEGFDDMLAGRNIRGVILHDH